MVDAPPNGLLLKPLAEAEPREPPAAESSGWPPLPWASLTEVSCWSEDGLIVPEVSAGRVSGERVDRKERDKQNNK